MRGELQMNDAMVAAETQEERKEASDFVELGDVSTETKGLVIGRLYDGAFGWWG